MNIRNELKQVLVVQSSSLRDVGRHISPEYEKAVRLIFNCKGKVIVTGIGKSGLVAQKIAATMASTGTPAFFLHPTEGMHGNLGIVAKNDVVLAIGKSGESEELLNILPSIKRIGAKLIALTGQKNSTLARQSQVVLHTPIEKEVCPLNLAPTTSTTVAMAVGDAIAVVLMKMRGFSSDSFALYHPGGLLGKKLLLRVSDVMRSGSRNPVVRVNDTFQKLLIEISSKWTGAASVVDAKRRLVGIVTDYDLRKLLLDRRRLAVASISSIMNAKPTFVYADQMAVEALAIMESRSKPFTVIPVVDRKRRSVGMVHIHDLITRGLLQPKEIS